MARGAAARARARLQWRQQGGERDPGGGREAMRGMDRGDLGGLIPGLASARRRPGRRTGAWPRRRRRRPPPAAYWGGEGDERRDGLGLAWASGKSFSIFSFSVFSVLLFIALLFISAPKQKVKTNFDLLNICYNVPTHFQDFQHFWKIIASVFKFLDLKPVAFAFI